MVFPTVKIEPNRFKALVGYSERDLAKRCGFRFDPQTSSWMTSNPDVVAGVMTCDSVEEFERSRDRKVRASRQPVRKYLSRRGWKTR